MPRQMPESKKPYAAATVKHNFYSSDDDSDSSFERAATKRQSRPASRDVLGSARDYKRQVPANNVKENLLVFKSI
jgi:hypothetical protein